VGQQMGSRVASEPNSDPFTLTAEGNSVLPPPNSGPKSSPFTLAPADEAPLPPPTPKRKTATPIQKTTSLSLPVLGSEAYSYHPLVSPGTSPMVRVLQGRARRSSSPDSGWKTITPGPGEPLLWGSWLDTNIDGHLEVLLPDQGGLLELQPRTKIFLHSPAILLRRGEIRVQIPSAGDAWLKIRTSRGFLQVGPGGIARIRPKGFARVRGPVVNLASEPNMKTE
jgi:hypothetical protein